MLTLCFSFCLPGWRLAARLQWLSQRNPLYSAISLIGVFISLACLYVMLAAPFIAAVQVIVYAGAIMVLVIFVIMLLNVNTLSRDENGCDALVPVAIGTGGSLDCRDGFHSLFGAGIARQTFAPAVRMSGLTHSIGVGLFTTYLLPFEITSILLLMAIVGAMTLARRADVFRRTCA